MNALSSPLGARQSLRLKTAATDLDQKQDQDQMSDVNVLQTICSGCLNETSGQFPAVFVSTKPVVVNETSG